MKKFMTALLGLSLFVGTATLFAADNTSKSTSTSKSTAKKAKKTKKSKGTSTSTAPASK